MVLRMILLLLLLLLFLYQKNEKVIVVIGVCSWMGELGLRSRRQSCHHWHDALICCN